MISPVLPSSDVELRSRSGWPPEEHLEPPLGSPRQATLEVACLELEVGEDKELKVGVPQKPEERWEEVRNYLSGYFCCPQSS